MALEHELRELVVDFDGWTRDPIAFSCDDAQAKSIREQVVAHGFAMVCLDVDDSDGVPEALVRLGTQLGLGDPFAPPVYAESASSVMVDRVRRLRGLDGDHPGFDSRAAQQLHTDGTLQRIGTVRTSVLTCVSPSEVGGETILFNTVRAFQRLAELDPAAFSWLGGPDVLVRSSSLGDGGSNVGPAIAMVDGRLVCSYCVDSTDTWNLGSSADGHRAVKWLMDASSQESEFFRAVRLDPGESIVIDNTVLAHGRRSFVDGPTCTRDYYRVLFTGAVYEWPES